MTRRYICVALVLGLALVHLAAQRAGTDPPVPFKVGEVLTYDISWSSYLTAGSATMSVTGRKPAGGGAAYDLVAEGRPVSLLDRLYHVYYKAESLLDTRVLQPALATVYSDERGRTKLRTTKFTGRTSIDFQPHAQANHETHRIPPQAQDPLSAIYAIRARPLQSGHGFTIPIVDGATTYNAKWQIAGPESVKTPMGTFPAWRLTPTLTTSDGKSLANYRVVLWISNDARRLPLKLEAGFSVGNFVLTLAKLTG
jgi:hypothetical protein